MVVTYLERIRERLQEEQININTELSIVNIKLKENTEIIKFLEEDEGCAEMFPYEMIEELKVEYKI